MAAVPPFPSFTEVLKLVANRPFELRLQLQPKSFVHREHYLITIVRSNSNIGGIENPRFYRIYLPLHAHPVSGIYLFAEMMSVYSVLTGDRMFLHWTEGSEW